MKKFFSAIIMFCMMSLTVAHADTGTMYTQAFENTQIGSWITGYNYPRGSKIEVREETPGGNRYGALALDMAKSTGNLYTDVTPTFGFDTTLTIEFSAMIRNSNGKGNAYFWIYDENRVYDPICKITGNDLYIQSGKTKIAELDDGVFYRCAYVIDFTTHTYDFYLDGEQLARKCSMGSFSGKELGFYRLSIEGISSGCSDIEFGIDDIILHTNNRPLTEEELAGTGNIDISMAPVRERVKNLLFFYNQTDRAFIDAKVETLPAKCSYEKNDLYIPLRFIVENRGGMVGYDAQSGIVSVSLNGKTITSAEDARIINKDGMAYIASMLLAELLGADCQSDNVGFAAIGDKSEFYDWDKDRKILFGTIRLLTNEYPDGYEIVADVIQKHNGAHPRVFATADEMALVREAVMSGEQPVAKWFDSIRKRCDADMKLEPIAYVPDSKGKIASSAQDSQYRIVRYSLAYWITGDKKYAEAGVKELLNICDTEKWPDWDYYFTLDPGEIAYGAGVGYDMLYYEMTENERKIVRDAIKRNIYKPFREDILGLSYVSGSSVKTDDPLDRSFPWREVDMRHNWTFIIEGGFTMAALAICDEEDSRVESEEILGYLVKDVEDIFYGFLPDGAWYEGSGYWSYMMKYGAGMLRALETACGTSYGLAINPGLTKTGEFIYGIQGPGGPFNFSDAGEAYVTGADSIFYLCELYNNKSLLDIAERFINNHGTSVFPQQIRDYVLAKHKLENVQESNEMPLDMLWRRIETAVMRDSWDDTTANFIGIHGGSNSETHGHMDSGSIILDALGKRFIMDLGKDEYSVSGGWLKYHNNAMGHNLLCFNPTTFGEGQLHTAFSDIIRFESNKADAITIMDVTEPWGKYVYDYKRGIRLTDNRDVFVVQDEYVLKDVTNEMWWFIHTKANDIQLSEDKRVATLTIDDIQLQAHILTDTPGEFHIMDPVGLPGSATAELKNQSVIRDVKKLGFKFDEVESGTFAVAFIPTRKGMPLRNEIPELQPMSEWKLLDDSSYEEAEQETVSAIYVDGKPIENFRPDVKSYDWNIDFGSEVVPVVTSDNENAQIYNANSFDDPAYVIVGKDSSETVYTINFRRSVITEKPENISELPFESITVSHEPQPQNCAAHLWDNDFATRWSATAPASATYDLGQKKPINAVGLSWYLGESRTADIEIFISDDNETWTRVYSGPSTGTTSGMEYYDIGACEARYVMVKGYKTPATSWVSINEFKVYDAK